MNEIISIHIGQAGVKIGEQCYQQFCHEHKIEFDGVINVDPMQLEVNNNFRSMFLENQEGKFTPRAIFADLEPTFVDEIRTSTYRQMYKAENFISGMQDASYNFAKGYFDLGREMIDPTIEIIRQQVESCNNLQGFLLFHSVDGGTGSGFGSLIQETISAQFGKISKIGFNIYPNPIISKAIVSPYNAIFSTHHLLQHTDVSFVLDNNALYDISKSKLDFQLPTYNVMNQLAVQLISCLTYTIRFGGKLNNDLTQIQSNLVPQNRLIFINNSIFPIETCETCGVQETTDEITQSLLRSDCQFIQCEPKFGKYLSACLNYFGDHNVQDVSESIQQKKLQKTFELEK